MLKQCRVDDMERFGRADCRRTGHGDPFLDPEGIEAAERHRQQQRRSPAGSPGNHGGDQAKSAVNAAQVGDSGPERGGQPLRHRVSHQEAVLVGVGDQYDSCAKDAS